MFWENIRQGEQARRDAEGGDREAEEGRQVRAGRCSTCRTFTTHVGIPAPVGTDQSQVPRPAGELQLRTRLRMSR